VTPISQEAFESRQPDAEADLCEECGHKISLHNDKYGCQVERGDIYESGYAPRAGGPCGCMAWTVEMIKARKA